MKQDCLKSGFLFQRRSFTKAFIMTAVNIYIHITVLLNNNSIIGYK